MLEPVSTGVAITLLVKSASSWLPAISDALIPPVRDALLGKSAERTFDRLGGQRRKIFHLDEKEQKRHLELALKNAAERGLAQFQTKEEQQQYNNVITVLSTSHADALRREAMPLLTLNDEPDFGKLNNLYHQLRSQTQPVQGKAVDVMPYLRSFFASLVAELYSDPYFRQQIGNALQVRAGLSMQRSLTEVLSTLNRIGGTLADNYTPEQFEKDVIAYTEHIERTLRYLKLVGVVPKERTNENRDPELDGIFVPLRIGKQEFMIPGVRASDSLVDFLAQAPCMVLLGGPGSGKSTATRHLAWSHAVSNLSNSTSLTNAPLLAGKPLPLRIELRRLNEDRRQRPDYDFLTYASEVLLGRAGLNVPPQMFELLLERRTMLVLFDGLDEVATLEDRHTLVEEIDSFARHYPGNHFLVTSRPVGYNLAPLSTQIFSKIQVQPFNDGQIHQFLENWYAHVLRLSPLSPDDQQELEELHTNLKDNPRLHALAENPLLLTVITALHRYERLPDKRILVYDRCADLLLETWARLKGTNVRWQDLQLSKEDQYACVAHLGFVLHERSQQEQEQENKAKGTGTQSNGDLANDVPSRFMLREIERFLQRQNLFLSIAEQNKQASRFLDLVKEEAGLIVERGTDENGESLYGFVHRTFQEYFAAADVYERYQQEENATIISKFLTEHLHDPHWSEVILLLLGKLKRKPATAQLRQILDGSTKSRLSEYTDILQQDLLFACTCLIEEIAVDSELAEYIIFQMSNLVKTSPFSRQRSECLDKLSALIRTRQYSDLALEALKVLISEENTLSLPAKINAAQIIYLNTHNKPDKRWLAIQLLLALAQQPNMPFEQSSRVVESLYTYSRDLPEVYRNELQALLNQAQQTNNTFKRAVEAIQPQPVSHKNESASSNSKKESSLPELLSAPNPLHERQPAQSIDQNDSDKLNELPNTDEQINADTPFEQAMHIARSLYELSSEGSYKKRRAIQILLKLAQRSTNSLDQGAEVAQALYEYSPNGSEEQWQANQILLHIVQGIFTPFKQAMQAAQVLVTFSFNREQAVQILLNLARQPARSVAEIVQIAQLLYQIAPPHAIQILLSLMEQPALSSEQVLWIVQMFIYRNKNVGLQARQRAIQMLWNQIYKSSASFVQVAWLAQTLYRGSPSGSKDQYQAVQILIHLVQRIDISTEQAIQTIQTLYEYSPDISEERRQAIQILLELAQRSGTPIEKTLLIILAFYEYSSERSQEWRQAAQLLINLSEQPDIPIEQVIHTAQTIYWISYGQLQKWQSAAQVLLKLTQRSDISTEQKVQIARSLYNSNSKESKLRQQVVEILLKSIQQSDLPPKEAEWIAWALYTDYYQNKVDSSDLSHIAEIAKLEILSTEIRDEMFRILQNMVLQFGNVGVRWPNLIH